MREGLRQRLSQIKVEMQEILDEQKLINSDRMQEANTQQALASLLDQNRRVVSYLNRQAIKEITTYKNVSQLSTALKLICILLDQDKWEARVAEQYDNKEFLETASKKLITSTSPSLQKRLSSFQVEKISLDKVEYLSNQIEITKFTVENVARISSAMGYIAKWVIGILKQRQLQIQLDPLIEQSKIRQAVTEKLPQELEKRRREIQSLENKLYGKDSSTEHF